MVEFNIKMNIVEERIMNWKIGWKKLFYFWVVLSMKR